MQHQFKQLLSWRAVLCTPHNQTPWSLTSLDAAAGSCVVLGVVLVATILHVNPHQASGDAAEDAAKTDQNEPACRQKNVEG